MLRLSLRLKEVQGKAEIAFSTLVQQVQAGSKLPTDDETIRDPQGKVVKTEKFGDNSLTFAQAHGTFLSGRPFDPNPQTRLCINCYHRLAPAVPFSLNDWS